MCSYLTGAGAQAAPSRPRPPPLRKLEKMGARIEEVCRFAGSTTPALARRRENRGGRRGQFVRLVSPCPVWPGAICPSSLHSPPLVGPPPEANLGWSDAYDRTQSVSTVFFCVYIFFIFCSHVFYVFRPCASMKGSHSSAADLESTWLFLSELSPARNSVPHHRQRAQRKNSISVDANPKTWESPSKLGYANENL